MEDDGGARDAWHLGKKVPIALIVTIIAQIIATVWMASKLDSRVETLERSDTRHERQLDTLNTEREGAKDRLVRLEESQRQALDLLRRVEAKLDHVSPPLGNQ